jgi:hypothetical protein
MKIISLGPNCASKAIIGNRTCESYPFDYVCSSLEMIRDCITTNFADFYDKNKLVENIEHFHATGMNSYGHEKYSIMIQTPELIRHHTACNIIPYSSIILHHNINDEDIYNSIKRKCNRFMNLFNNNDKVLFIYTIEYIIDNYNFQQFVDFLNFIRTIKTNTYILIVMKHSCENNFCSISEGLYIYYYTDKKENVDFDNIINIINKIDSVNLTNLL